MATKKAFKDLTPKGQAQRLAKYAKEREARGNLELKGNVARPIKLIEGVDKEGKPFLRGVMTVAFNQEKNEKGETVFRTLNFYTSNEGLMNVYRGLKVGSFITGEYAVNEKEGNVYHNIQRIYDKSKGKVNA